MRHILLVIIFLLSTNMFTQNNRRFSGIGLASGNKSFYGDNFLAKTYFNSLMVSIDLRGEIYAKFGAGVTFRNSNAKLKTNQYVGNSINGNIKEWSFYITYNQQISKKWLFVPKLGIATFQLRNQFSKSLSYSYYTNGTTYFVAPEIHYLIHENISLFSNVDYGFIDFSRVDASSSLTNYKSSTQLNIEFGIKFWL